MALNKPTKADSEPDSLEQDPEVRAGFGDKAAMGRTNIGEPASNTSPAQKKKRSELKFHWMSLASTYEPRP